MRRLSLLFLALLFAGHAMAQCVANFSQVATPNGPGNPLQHTFTNLSTVSGSTAGKAVTFTMDYGDGFVDFFNASWTSVAHRYPSTGTYNARLSIRVFDSTTNTVVCTDTARKSVSVNYSPCSFYLNVNKINDSTFSMSAISLTGAIPLSYAWNFGDGSTATGTNPTHTYSSPGYYTVRVTSTGTGCTDTAMANVYVYWPQPFSCSLILKSSYVSSNMQMAHVNAYGYIPPGFPTLRMSYQYNYGDGSATTTSNQHAYAAVGTYYIKTYFTCTDTLTSSVLCQDTLVDSVNILQLPSPCSFTINATQVNDSVYTFTPVAQPGATGISYTWNFGDGSVGSGPNPTHTYTHSGLYSIVGRSTSALCNDTAVVYIYVNRIVPFNCSSIIKARSVSVNRNVATVNANAIINPQYTGFRTDFRYSYGDGSGITASNQHTYSAVGRYQIKTYFTCSDSITLSVVCADTLIDSVNITQIYSSLQGNVFFDSTLYGAAGQSAKVYLIVYDSVAATLRAVDSTLAVYNGSRYFTFYNVPTGQYLVKAALFPATAGGTGFVPTYSDSSLLWSSARRINHNGNFNTGNAHIHPRSGTVTAGPGFIGGSVTLGANKGTGSGVPGVSLILRNAAGKLVAMTETDAQGRYAFNNVPLGSYTVMPELLNYDAVASAPITISASNTSVTDLYFTKDDNQKSIHAAALGISKAGMSLVSVSPVPASDFIRITPGNGISAATPVTIRDLSGKVLLQSEIRPGTVLRLDIRSLPAGLYLVHPGAGAPVKLLVQ